MNERYELIHEIGDFPKVRWDMTSNVDRLFAEASAKLGNPRDRDMIQSPQRILVESGWALLQTNFHKGCEEIVCRARFFS